MKATIAPTTCQHSATKFARKQVSGRYRFYNQCQQCGQKVGREVPVLKATSGYVPWDSELEESGKNRQRARRFHKHVQSLVDREDWQRRYENHLASLKWRKLRELVFKRSGGLCEGCGVRPAHQVHHLTYEHMGDEFLWELQAVCKVCHGRCHPEKGL
jgi:5-methylcytosine-specific restriction endonuclease McrA